MPLLGQYRLGGADVAVWRITETLDELLGMVPEDCAVYALDAFSSEKRRVEWLAVRAVLARLFGNGARVVYDAAGKPVLEGACGHISVSHTSGFAVVAFSRDGEVGVDVLPVAGRFMQLEHLEGLQRCESGFVALVHWCAKEALFKIVGDLGGNFKDNILVGIFDPHRSGSVPLSITGIYGWESAGFVADYSVFDGLLVVLCRRDGVGV